MSDLKQPSEEQINMVQEFAGALEGVLAIVAKYELNNISAIVGTKLQEAMHWFHSGVMNDVMSIAAPTPVVEDHKAESVNDS